MKFASANMSFASFNFVLFKLWILWRQSLPHDSSSNSFYSSSVSLAQIFQFPVNTAQQTQRHQSINVAVSVGK